MVRSEDVPLVIKGRYSGEIDFHVWVALEDSKEIITCKTLK